MIFLPHIISGKPNWYIVKIVLIEYLKNSGLDGGRFGTSSIILDANGLAVI